MLLDADLSAGSYHAGMSTSARKATLQAWQRGAQRNGFNIMCATIAMGMGIDQGACMRAAPRAARRTAASLAVCAAGGFRVCC